LVELQFLVDKKTELLRGREETPKRIAEMEKEFERFEGDYLLKKTEYENAVKMRRSLEQEIKDLDARVARSKSRQHDVKTNREYQALLKEIEDLKGDISAREDQVLNRMETIERLEKEVKGVAQDLEKRRKKLDEDKNDLLLQSQEVDVRIAKLEALEQEVRARCTEELLKRYDFLRDKRAGRAVAAVENNVCQICHMNIPHQKFIELQRDETIHSCPHCQRFIYWSGSEAYRVLDDDFGAI
jgi:hypothetical protein